MTLLLPPFHAEPFQPLAMAAAETVVSVLWESALLVAATGLVLRLVPRLGAASRFVVWMAVFAVSAALPLVHLAGAAATSQGSPAPLRFDVRWSYALAGLWVAASVYRLATLAVQAARLRSLWTNAVPQPAMAIAGSELAALLAARRVACCTSSEVDRPSVIGFLAPRILIPTWLSNEMTPGELRHVVLHEMEHLRRRDDWMNLLQKIALVAFPLNPALVWLDRRLAAERELACDDGVLAATHTPRAYASCLASIAERRLERRLPGRVVTLALGVLGASRIFRNRPEFSQRIEGILSRKSDANPALTGAVAAMLLLGIAGAGAVLALSPQLVSFAPAAAATVANGTPPFHHEDVGAMAARLPSPRTQSIPEAHSQNVIFHRAISPPRAKSLAASRATAPAGDLVQRASAAQTANKSRWFVLTSAGHEAPAQVVFRTPDGRYFVAPYAAVPVAIGTQDGWLILQL